jgi:hypothetical protein
VGVVVSGFAVLGSDLVPVPAQKRIENATNDMAIPASDHGAVTTGRKQLGVSGRWRTADSNSPGTALLY